MKRNYTSLETRKRPVKTKIKRLKWLIDFLEEDLTIDDLVLNPKRSVELGKGLSENFLQGENIQGWDRDFFSKDKMEQYKSLYENPQNLKTAHSIIGGLVKNIYAYHDDLGTIWDGFKTSLKRYRESIIKGLGVEYFTIKVEHTILLDSKNIEIKIEDAYIESPIGESSQVSSRITEQFLDLIEGLSFDRFHECKACKRWFVSNYSGKKRQKLCCSNRCSSRINKYDMRHNPNRRNQYNKEKEYQKKRYRKKVLGSAK